MTTPARLIASLLGLAVAACTFLPWVADLGAWHLHVRTLLTPGSNLGVSSVASIGLVVAVAGALVLLGALANSRVPLILGGLVAVGVPAIWILSNAVSHASKAIVVSQIQVGAYGAAALGLMTLILAAVATDGRAPSTR